MKNKIVKSLLILSMITTMSISSLSVPFITNAAQGRASVTAVNGVVDFNRGSAKITIQGNPSQTLAGKRFNIYMLFHAENSVGGESINYTFNPEYKSSLQTVVGQKIGKNASEVTEYEVIDYIQSLNRHQVEGAYTEQELEGSYSDFRYFVEELRSEIVRQGVAGDVVHVTSTNGQNEIVVDGLQYGYYIIDETSDVGGDHSAASLCMLNTANPTANINIKSDYPSVVKKIQEDDSRDLIGNSGWNDIADYEIGQTVPYKFESAVPNMNGYQSYYFAWHDVMDDALTFHKDSVGIVIRDDQSNKSYTLDKSEYVVTENPGNGDTFMVEIHDLKKIVDREFDQRNELNENIYGQDITLIYNATLNDHAADDMGRPGYENDVRLQFSNDPDATGVGSTGFTPWDTVVCFTYQLDVLKTNNHDLRLEGAKFRLYSDENCENEVYVKKTNIGYIVINRDSLGGNDNTGGSIPAEAVEMITDEKGSLVINGLDDGTYYLMETEAPAGYRKLLDPIVLTIDATFTQLRNDYVKGDGATTKTLEKLEASAHIKTFLEGAYEEEDIVLETNVDTGTANINVINAVGKKLPVTGSFMTPVIIALGAGFVTYSLKKKKEDELHEEKY